MELVLDHELTERESTGNYPHLSDTFDCGIFYGYHIKSEYDEKRLLIKQNPLLKKFTFETNNGPYKLYGLLDENIDIKLLKNLKTAPPTCIGEYNSLLTLNGLSCLTCFLYFSPGLYPIDTYYASRFFPNINTDIFSCNKEVVKFQRIGHTYLFALINLSKNN